MCLYLHLSFHLDSDLDKRESWPGAERLRFVLHLILDVLLHALLLIDVLLFLHVEENSGRHSDGDGILRLWLEERVNVILFIMFIQ